MNAGRILGGAAAGAMLVATLALTPAIGASQPRDRARLSLELRDGVGAFTPATTDVRLAASLAGSGLGASGFRFTPATTVRVNRSVTVAVRARSTTGASAGSSPQVALVAPQQAAITPIAYNLGVAVGWKRFAVQGDMERVEIAGLGRREVADVGVSYTNRRLTTRVQLAADRTTGPTSASPLAAEGVSVDFGSSYRLTRNLDVTAGVRYRAERSDRLLPQADNRRDSQAVYVGTAFRF
jgi:hypothetical protein